MRNIECRAAFSISLAGHSLWPSRLESTRLQMFLVPIKKAKALPAIALGLSLSLALCD